MKESNSDNKKNINKTDSKIRADTQVRPYKTIIPPLGNHFFIGAVEKAP